MKKVIIMEGSIKSHVHRILSKYNFTQEDATFISDLLQEIDDKQDFKFKENKDYFLNKNDKVELVQLMKNDKLELIQLMKNDKLELIDRINKSKIETIVWIVSIGVLQFILTILSKNFL